MPHLLSFLFPMLVLWPSQGIRAFDHDWSIRNGKAGPIEWRGPGARWLSVAKRIELDLSDTPSSGAGVVLGRDLGFGTYTVELSGRLDTLNPAAVMAVWLYDDRPNVSDKKELDFEFSQWNDQGRAERLMLTVYSPEGNVEQQILKPGGSFERYRVALTYFSASSGVKVEGWDAGRANWRELAALNRPRQNSRGATLRIGLWRAAKTLPGTAKGTTRVHVDAFSFVPE